MATMEKIDIKERDDSLEGVIDAAKEFGEGVIERMAKGQMVSTAEMRIAEAVKRYKRAWPEDLY